MLTINRENAYISPKTDKDTAVNEWIVGAAAITDRFAGADMEQRGDLMLELISTLIKYSDTITDDISNVKEARG